MKTRTRRMSEYVLNQTDCAFVLVVVRLPKSLLAIYFDFNFFSLSAPLVTVAAALILNQLPSDQSRE
jgi:hypothetical protein